MNHSLRPEKLIRGRRTVVSRRSTGSVWRADAEEAFRQPSLAQNGVTTATEGTDSRSVP